MTRANVSTARMHAADLLFGSSSAVQSIRRKLEVVAATDFPVLIQGETGTGKALCAQLIHDMSGRFASNFVQVNCPAFPSALVETELFGYAPAFLSATTAPKRGRVEQADHGTLLLDDVDTLSATAQAKLLQLLQDGSFSHVGGHEVLRSNARVLSSTSHDLRQMVEAGTFRRDLLYRLNAMVLQLPPLRRRMEDLPMLAHYFAGQHARAFGRPTPPVSRGMLQMMQSYDWPGNLRQLENVMRTYVLTRSEEEIAAELALAETTPDLRLPDVDVTQPIPLKRVVKSAVQELERQIILKVLQANRWNRQKTAKWLQISYRSLLYKLNELGPDGLPKSRRVRDVAHEIPR